MSKSITIVFVFLTAALFFSCDNNDDVATPTDGFTVDGTFHETANAYITIDQMDANNDTYPDHYNFFFTDGRITDTPGVINISYPYAFSTNTSKLVKIKVLVTANPSLTTGTITAGNTYIGSSFTTVGANFSSDSIIAYNLQTSSPITGVENGIDFSDIPEPVGIWHYVGTTGPTITINAINIDTVTPENSTADVDYTFMDTNGTVITGSYQGTLGIILD